MTRDGWVLPQYSFQMELGTHPPNHPTETSASYPGCYDELLEPTVFQVNAFVPCLPRTHHPHDCPHPLHYCLIYPSRKNKHPNLLISTTLLITYTITSNHIPPYRQVEAFSPHDCPHDDVWPCPPSSPPRAKGRLGGPGADRTRIHWQLVKEPKKQHR